MRDVVVIGNGLFGSIITKQLEQQGHDVTVIDDKNPSAGSRPAACLMKPSWISGLGSKVVDPSLQTLDYLYGVHDLEFTVKGGFKTTVRWCQPSDILCREPDIQDTVTLIRHGRGGYTLMVNSGEYIECKRLVIAAGVWTTNIIKVPGLSNMQGKAGVAFTLPNKGNAIDPFIEVWAPYKQLVCFDRGDGLWIGDGSSILERNWTEQREEQSRKRCADALARRSDKLKGLGPSLQAIYGVRPYVKCDGPCYLEHVENNLFIATGGAKNGTVAAGWCAYKISEAWK